MFIFIIIGILIGIASLYIGSNIDKSWNVFKGIRCFSCGTHTLTGSCECGKQNKYGFLLIVVSSVLLTVLSYLYFDREIYVALILIFVMMSVTVSDVIEQIVPDRLIIIFLPVLLILRYFIQTDPWYLSYLGGFIAFSVLYLIALLGEKIYKKEVLGGGDIKLYAIIGLVIGPELVFLSLFFASLIGLLIIKTMSKYFQKEYIPFVPLITLGVFISYFYGTAILDWYFGLF